MRSLLSYSQWMDTTADRLRWARARAGYSNARQAADAFGFNYSTYSGHENGGRNTSKAKAQRYAKAFKVRWEWVLHGWGEALEEPRLRRPIVAVPLISWVSAGKLTAGETVMADAVLTHLEMADLPDGDWAALEVEGDSMDRIAPPGSTIIVNRSDTILRPERCYVVGTEEGETTFKRYRAGPDRLQPFSTNPDHETIPLTGQEIVFGRLRRVIIDVK